MSKGHLATRPVTETAAKTALPALAHAEAPKGRPADVKGHEGQVCQTGP